MNIIRRVALILWAPLALILWCLTMWITWTVIILTWIATGDGKAQKRFDATTIWWLGTLDWIDPRA
jgi:hypothetical protein